jgi:hypothetical protein
MPVKDSHTRIKPLALASDHGRYMHNRYTRTGACVRWGIGYAYSRYKFIAASLPERLHSSRFASETATWIQKWLKMPVGNSREL